MNNIFKYYNQLNDSDKSEFFEKFILDAVETGKPSIILFTKKERNELLSLDMQSVRYKQIQQNAIGRAFLIRDSYLN